MARIDADALQDPVNIYVTGSLPRARAVEALLTSHGVDYAVEVESLGRTTLFGSLRHGAAFFVSSARASYCLAILREADLREGIVASDH